MNNEYITLITSLPSLGRSYDVEQTPISRYQLEKRLALLTDEHCLLLEKVEKVLHWDHLNSHYDDGELIDGVHQLAKQLQCSGLHTLNELIQWRLNLRTLLAALRYRQRGEDFSESKRQWGVGGLVRHIENNWAHPQFNLQGRFDWLESVANALQKKDTMLVERLLFTATWNCLARVGNDHYFDFTAVVRYVLMWNLVSRWASYDVDKGAARFKELATVALGDFAELEFSQ